MNLNCTISRRWRLSPDRIVGLEALIRWNHPKRGLLLPVDLYSDRGNDRKIVSIGEWLSNRLVPEVYQAWIDEDTRHNK